MTQVAKGTFDVVLSDGLPELEGKSQRREFTKDFSGDLDARGVGLMISAGDPQLGSAGYVAMEIVSGSLAGRQGSFALQQLGKMHAGSSSLVYEVVPGSGEGELSGLAGTIGLVIEDDGTHRYELEYTL